MPRAFVFPLSFGRIVFLDPNCAQCPVLQPFLPNSNSASPCFHFFPAGEFNFKRPEIASTSQFYVTTYLIPPSLFELASVPEGAPLNCRSLIFNREDLGPPSPSHLSIYLCSDVGWGVFWGCFCEVSCVCVGWFVFLFFFLLCWVGVWEVGRVGVLFFFLWGSFRLFMRL